MNTKKITALALAALMAAGTTTAAFAATDAGDKKPALVFESTGVYENEDGVLVAGDGEYAPGDTLYFLLEENTNATADYDDNDRKRVNVYADWKVGGDNIESIDVVYKKGEASTNTTGYVYTVTSTNTALNGKKITIAANTDALNDVKDAIEADSELMAAALAAGYTKLETGYAYSNKYYTDDVDGLKALLAELGWTQKSSSDEVTSKTDSDSNGVGTISAGTGTYLTDTIWVDSGNSNFIDVATITSISDLLAISGDAESVDPSTLLSGTAAVGADAYVAGDAPANGDTIVDKSAADAAILASVSVDSGSPVTVPVVSYTYWVEVKTKDSDTTKALDVAGTLYLGTTKNKAEDAVTGDSKAVDFTLTNQNDDYYVNGNVSDEATIEPDSNGAVKFADDADEVTIYFGSNEDAWYTFDAKGQGAVNFAYTMKFNSEIADLFPKANIDFITWTATPATNRTGDLYITADEDTFLYEVTEDGIKEVNGAKYDEDEGAWHIRTRKLTAYAISDIELDTSVKLDNDSSSSTSSGSNTDGGKDNPDTGR